LLREFSSNEPRMKLNTATGLPNIEHIINFLDFSLRRGLEGKLELIDLIMTIDAHYLLELEIPHKSELINYYDSQQREDGTWNTGKKHYVPNTAHILLFYDRVSVHPKRPLDSFIQTINTWDKVFAHAKKYDRHNFWGGVWGYVFIYVVYKKQRPPWTNDFFNCVKNNFESWAYDNHQRNRVSSMFFVLCETIPRLEEVVDIAIKQQNSDGGWGFSRKDSSNVRETAQTIWFLKNFQSSNPNVENTIKKATSYVSKNYKTATFENKKLGGFSLSMGEHKLEIRSTTHGLQILTGKYDALSRWKICSNNANSGI